MPAQSSAAVADRASKTADGIRDCSKTAVILDLLRRPGGATATGLMVATGWQKHSIHGFLSGTVGKKLGLAIATTKGAGGERIYSLKP